jgi:hypothetical protein
MERKSETRLEKWTPLNYNTFSFRLRSPHGLVCPKDHLPGQNTPRAYIVNTHNANQPGPGEHWVMLFFKENKTFF